MVERKCIATGKILPAYRLIRFVAAPDGYAVADLSGRLPGRGAWVAAEAEAIRKADKKSQFQLCLGVGLRSVDHEIDSILVGLRQRALTSASLARRAGMLLGGSGKLLAEGPFIGLLAANDASARQLRKLKSKLGVKWVSRALTATEIGQICGRDSLAFAGLREIGPAGASKLVQNFYEEITRLDGFYAAVGCNDMLQRCITGAERSGLDAWV